ncbi:hypothetical protein M0802_013306 [Mischocyttarus mexicanus]|nr:hypothetical protein M0802_013306 [Mischocyttarus mexicanus]
MLQWYLAYSGWSLSSTKLALENGSLWAWRCDAAPLVGMRILMKRLSTFMTMWANDVRSKQTVRVNYEEIFQIGAKGFSYYPVVTSKHGGKNFVNQSIVTLRTYYSLRLPSS